MEDLEEAKLGIAVRILRTSPCRNGVDPTSFHRPTLPGGTILVMERVESTEKPDSHKRDYVYPGWCFDRIAVEMARAVGCCWIKLGNRSSPACDAARPDGIR